MNEFITETKTDQYRNYKFAGVVLAFIYCLYYLSTKSDWHFIDNVNLIIHEAGHVVFMMFGNTLTIAGGSILQVLVPLVFFGYFFFRQAYNSAVIVLFWAGLSLINVSVYAGDAVKMQLPLLTGDTDGHDWNQLLFQFGQLRHAEFISNTILVLGIILILVGLIFTSANWYKNRAD